MAKINVVDPDLVESAFFVWIQFWICIHFNRMQSFTSKFSRKFQYTVQKIENYDTYDADETDKTM
jgi:hypothetical protein